MRKFWNGCKFVGGCALTALLIVIFQSGVTAFEKHGVRACHHKPPHVAHLTNAQYGMYLAGKFDEDRFNVHQCTDGKVYASVL